MTARRHYSRQRNAKNGRHHVGRRRRGRWSFRKARLGLFARRAQALDQIEQALTAQDPDLRLTFAVFTRLTHDEAMPLTEQVPGRVQRFARPAFMVPLLATSLITMLSVGWLLPVPQRCPLVPRAVAHSISQVIHAERCQPSPSPWLNQMPLR